MNPNPKRASGLAGSGSEAFSESTGAHQALSSAGTDAVVAGVLSAVFCGVLSAAGVPAPNLRSNVRRAGAVQLWALHTMYAAFTFIGVPDAESATRNGKVKLTLPSHHVSFSCSMLSKCSAAGREGVQSPSSSRPSDGSTESSVGNMLASSVGLSKP